MTVAVSDHAKLRWLQRVSPTAGDVTAVIRERFENASRTDEQVNGGIGWRTDDVILVTDRDQEIVRTVLLAGDCR